MVVFAVFVLLLVVAVEQRCAAEPLVVRVNKCCPLHQQLALNQSACLDYDYEKYEVTRAVRSTPTPSTTTSTSASPPRRRLPWWVSAELGVVTPSGAEVGAAEAAWVASAGVLPGCSPARRSLLMQHLQQFSVTHDGRLLLYGDDGDGDEADEAPLELPAGAFCLDRIKDGDGRLVALACQCSAASAWCWRRCCPAGYKLDVADLDRVHQEADCVKDSATHGDAPWLPNTPNMRRLQIYGFPKCEKGEHVSTTHEAQSWELLSNGSALLEGVARAQPLERYCADAGGLGGRGQLLYCSARSVSWAPNRQRGLLYGLLFGVGGLFLLATVLLYSCLPGLLARMHARVVVCHAASLLGAYIALAILQTWPEMPLPACSAMAFIVQYSFLAAFFWLNVMCLDISWAFSVLRPRRRGAWEGDWHRFRWFSGYAWGGAALVCGATAAVEFSDWVPRGATLKPDFGAVRCWFRGREATLLYFYGPVALLLVGNLLLFTFTAVRIFNVHKETQMLNMVDGRRCGKSKGQGINRKERERLVLYVKLFGLMGLTWVMEIVSWAVGGPAYYWYLTDLVNLLRAVFLFYLFCCKRSVLRLLRSHLPACCPWSLPPSERDGGSSKSKSDTRSRSLTSQRTTSFKLTDQHVLQLAQLHLSQQLAEPQPQQQLANGHVISAPDTTKQVPELTQQQLPQQQLGTHQQPDSQQKSELKAQQQQANGHLPSSPDSTKQIPQLTQQQLPQQLETHQQLDTQLNPEAKPLQQQANDHLPSPPDTTQQVPQLTQQQLPQQQLPQQQLPQQQLPQQQFPQQLDTQQPPEQQPQLEPQSQPQQDIGLPQQLDAQQLPKPQSQLANGHTTSPPDTTPV